MRRRARLRGVRAASCCARGARAPRAPPPRAAARRRAAEARARDVLAHGRGRGTQRPRVDLGAEVVDADAVAEAPGSNSTDATTTTAGGGRTARRRFSLSADLL